MVRSFDYKKSRNKNLEVQLHVYMKMGVDGSRSVINGTGCKPLSNKYMLPPLN